MDSKISLPLLHMKIKEALVFKNHGTILDGVFASSAIDTSGEILSIEGADLTSLNDGTGKANTEHISPDSPKFKEAKKDEEGYWSTIVGRVLFAKKIFTAADCESERELQCWEELQLPFIYGAIELFDNDGHVNAGELAAQIRHYNSRGLPILARYSIEGNTLERDGNILKQTVCRSCALTVKPCNHSAISSLVADASKPILEPGKELSKSEKKYLSSNERQCFPLVLEEDPNFHFRADVNKLLKTLSLGSYNAAPSSLTGGAALSKEDVVGKKDKKPFSFWKAQILAAVRDWPKTGSLKEFVKHKLPDVDENILARFDAIADRIRLDKSESLKKIELPHIDEKPQGSIKYLDKYVIPGELRIVQGPFQGSKLKLLHLNDQHAHVEAFKAGDQLETKINRLSRKAEGTHYLITKQPKVLDIPILSSGLKNTHNINTGEHQQDMIHGIDLAKPIWQPFTSSWHKANIEDAFGWFKNHRGQQVLVKPDVKSDKDFVQGIGTAKREVVFYNMARDVFHLDQCVPQTALLVHPETSVEHSVQQQVPHAEHLDIKNPGKWGQILKQAGDLGQLDQLAIFDNLMGSQDRHRTNYMLSPAGVHLIDNALIFHFNDHFLPAYFSDYLALSNQSLDTPLHPEAAKWLLALDAFTMRNLMLLNEVPPAIAAESVKRLLSMQSEYILGHKTRNQVLFSNHEYKENPNHHVDLRLF